MTGDHREASGPGTKAYIALALVCFFWGTTWVASKIAVQYMPALQMAGIRQTIAGILFVGWFLARRTPLPKGRDWITILVLAFTNFVISNSFTAWGVQYIPSGLGSIIGATFPLWLVMINMMITRSVLPARVLLGFLLGFGGVCIIFYEHLEELLDTGFRFGIGLSLFATIMWAFGSIYLKKKAAAFNPYFSLGFQLLIAGPVLLTVTKAFSIAGLPSFIPFGQIPWQAWLGIAYLVVFGSIVAFAAYIYSLQHLPAEEASLYAYVNPVVAILLGSILFAEPFTIYVVAGGAVCLSGVFLVNRTMKRVTAKSLPLPEEP